MGKGIGGARWLWWQRRWPWRREQAW